MPSQEVTGCRYENVSRALFDCAIQQSEFD